MATVNCTKYENEIGTMERASLKCGMPVPKIHMGVRITGSLLALSLVAFMQSANGSESSNVSHPAAAAQGSVSVPTVNTPTGKSSMGFGSLAAGAENEPKIVWEPIGKYSKKEINLASDAIGGLFSHMKKMEAIESSVIPLIRSGYKSADKETMLRTAKNYSAEAQEEGKKLDQFGIPALKNRQAIGMILKAKAALKNASEIQKERAAKVVQLVSGNGDANALAGQIQELGSQRISAAFQFVSAYMAYESYGYTSDQIDLSTGRLKKDAKPDRMESNPQKAK